MHSFLYVCVYFLVHSFSLQLESQRKILSVTNTLAFKFSYYKHIGIGIALPLFFNEHFISSLLTVLSHFHHFYLFHSSFTVWVLFAFDYKIYNKGNSYVEQRRRRGRNPPCELKFLSIVTVAILLTSFRCISM